MSVQTTRQRAEAEKRLGEEFSEEVTFFKKVFLWTGCKKGCYVRYAYEPQVIDGFHRQKWSPIKTRGRWQPLYVDLVDSLAEKHLHFERFCRTRSSKDRLSPHDAETAFWVGTMAGATTRTHAIDIDAHDFFGWYAVPSRWHMSRTGWVHGPYSFRVIPVIRPCLRFFMTAKLVHDHFPNRIWSFSSGNLGLSVWKVYPHDLTTHVNYRQVACRLASAGLGHLEQYPCPARTSGSLGKCHRRPCGADSGVITPSGVITDPIEQVRWFMGPGKTPTFEQILDAYWIALDKMYDQFLAAGESLNHTRMSLAQRKLAVEECQGVVAEIKLWAANGCPIDKSLVSGRSGVSPTEELVTHISNSTEKVGRGIREKEEAQITFSDSPPAPSSNPQIFETVDLAAIKKAGLWVQFVGFLVEHGIPAEDKFFEVISTLAKWFALVEWRGRPTEEIKGLLRRYVLRRNNGKVSRLLTGQNKDVLGHVDRIVEAVLDKGRVDDQGVFTDLRARWAGGYYRQSFRFAPVILGTGSAAPSSSVTADFCDEARATADHTRWEYAPDDTPLDDSVIERIRVAFKKRKKQLRRGKDGRYPTLDAITRFINYLLAGRVPGQRRASQQLLIKMGFPTSGRKRSAIINLLVREGLLRKGGYRALEDSRQWTLILPTSDFSPISGVDSNEGQQHCHQGLGLISTGGNVSSRSRSEPAT